MKLSEIYDFSNGKGIKLSQNGMFPIYGSTGIVGKTDSFLIDGPNTLIARVGANCGFTQYVSGKYWVTDNTLIATVKGDNLPQYGYYLLGTLNLSQYKIGAAQPLLTIGILNAIETNVHNINDQRHIVNIIGTIDDLIEKKQIEYNKKLKYLLFLLDKSESDKTSTFGYVFKSFSGGTFKSKYYVTNSNKKLITIKNIDDSGFNTNNVSQLSEEKADNKYLLSIGDIVLTMTGNIGRSGIVDENNCYLNQRVLKITSVSSSYLFAYLHKYKKEIIQLGKGTAQLNLSLDDLKKLKVFNSNDEISSFKKYDCLYSSLLNCKLVIKKAKQIKQLLLSKYF